MDLCVWQESTTIGSIRYDTIPYDTIPYDAIRYDTIRYHIPLGKSVSVLMRLAAHTVKINNQTETTR